MIALIIDEVRSLSKRGYLHSVDYITCECSAQNLCSTGNVRSIGFLSPGSRAEPDIVVRCDVINLPHISLGQITSIIAPAAALLATNVPFVINFPYNFPYATNGPLATDV